MVYRLIAFLILIIAYLACLIGRINNNTSINKLGEKADIDKDATLGFELFGISEKDKKALFLKLLISISFVALLICEILSIVNGDAILGYTGRGILLKVFGTYIGIISDCIFIAWNYEKIRNYRKWKNNNIKEHFITTGIYRYSRFPGALAMALLCLSILLMYFNYYLLVISFIFLIMLHIFFCYKDRKLCENEGTSYEKYKDYTHMYYGRGKWNVRRIKLTLYAIVFAFSVLYYFTCIIYAKITLSGVWMWPALAVFSVIRIIMLEKIEPLRRRGKLSLKLLSLLYHFVMFVIITVFVVTEFFIIKAMNNVPDNGLDYVVVLGAGLTGDKPTRPLRLRIERAYRYLSNSPETKVIASGGQGSDEIVSEALVIKNELIALGIDENRIILEDKSTSTEENIRFSYLIINEYENNNADSVNVGIVTNSFHMYRATLIAEALGHNVEMVPAQTLFPLGIHYVVREAAGVVVMKLLHRI